MLSAWYDHLMSMDVELYDFTANRPITQGYKDIVDKFAPNVYKFMNDLISTDDKHEEHKINSKEITALDFSGPINHGKVAQIIKMR